MAIHFNESDVAPAPFGSGAQRQRLLTEERVKGTNILLDRWRLEPGGAVEVDVPAKNIAWFQMLEGEAVLDCAGNEAELSKSHTGYLPPGTRGTLGSKTGATLLYVEIPDAGRFDNNLPSRPSAYRVIDWTREPVLQSEHDARKRIYVATPALFGTRAIKAEMIIYPPGTSGSNHHHVGCEHFKYVLSGRSIGYTNESPHSLRAGDVVYHFDLERHYSSTDGNEDLRFIEFFVPGEFKTVWADETRVCAWIPSGRNVLGEKPTRNIKAHSSADFASPQDV